jgi:hypothetical protein
MVEGEEEMVTLALRDSLEHADRLVPRVKLHLGLMERTGRMVPLYQGILGRKELPEPPVRLDRLGLPWTGRRVQKVSPYRECRGHKDRQEVPDQPDLLSILRRNRPKNTSLNPEYKGCKGCRGYRESQVFRVNRGSRDWMETKVQKVLRSLEVQVRKGQLEGWELRDQQCFWKLIPEKKVRREHLEHRDPQERKALRVGRAPQVPQFFLRQVKQMKCLLFLGRLVLLVPAGACRLGFFLSQQHMGNFLGD